MRILLSFSAGYILIFSVNSVVFPIVIDDWRCCPLLLWISAEEAAKVGSCSVSAWNFRSARQRNMFWVCEVVHFSQMFTPPLIGGQGIVFNRFLCFFVTKITSKWLDQFAWNLQGRCGVTMGWPDYILGQFRQIGRRVKGQLVITGHSYLVWLLSSGSSVLPSRDWECNEISVFGLLLHCNTGARFVVLHTTACFYYELGLATIKITFTYFQLLSLLIVNFLTIN